MMNGGNEDSFLLDRFVRAQEADYDQALREIRQGEKRSHWMWYIFPQFVGLGRSEIAHLYAIKSVAEARAYLGHPVLGPRLLECCEALLLVEGKSATEIFGFSDDVKLRSCSTLFAHVSPPGSVFECVIEKYFHGHADAATLELIGNE